MTNLTEGTANSPPRTAVAFVTSDEAAEGAIQSACTSGTKSLTIVSTGVIPLINSHDDIEIETRLLSESRPHNLDLLVLEEIQTRYDRWINKHDALSADFDLFRISNTIRLSFPRAVYEHFRNAIIARRIVAHLNPDLILADSACWDCTMLIDSHPVQACGSRTDPSLHNRRPGVLAKRASLGIATTFGYLLSAIVIGNIVNLFARRIPPSTKAILIGDESPNNSFRPVWNELKQHWEGGFELRVAVLKISSIWRTLRARLGWFEGHFNICRIPSLLADYLRLYFRYSLSDRSGLFPNSMRSSTDPTEVLDRFFIVGMAKALLSMRMCGFPRKFAQLQVVLFSTHSPGAASLAEYLQQQGVRTVSTTHGMVLEPIAYRSHDWLKIVWGEYDAELLSKYSEDERFFGLPHNPEAAKRTTATNDWNASLFADALATYQSANIKHGSALLAQTEPGYALILPSTNLHGATLARFLSVCMEFLSTHQTEFGFDTIVVKPKRHPRTDYGEYRTLLSGFVSQTQNLRIVLTDTVSISQLLRCAVFALCAHSSIILDCIRLGVPFSVFEGASLSDRSFVTELADWMRFSNREDLQRITRSKLGSFEIESTRLRRLYWGDHKSPRDRLRELADELCQS